MSWNRIKLGVLCDMTSGGTPSRNVLSYYNGGIPWAKISDIESAKDGVIYSTEETITTEGLRSISNRIFPKGTLLLAMYGSVGKIAFTGTDMSTNQAILGIRIKDDNLLSIAYLKFWFQTIQKKLLNRAVGGTLQNISLGIVKDLDIPLPSISVQKQIAEILNDAYILRNKDQELLSKYDNLVKSIFINMFGNPIKNEKKWEVKQLKNISTKIHSGNTPKGGSNVYVKGGITFFRSQNVWKNRLVYDDIAFIDEATHKSMNKSSLKHGDILITKTGRINTDNSSLGRAALYLGEDDRGNINGHVYLVRLREEVVREFVLFILTTDEYRDYIRSVCVGGIDKRQLNKEHIEEFPIIFPPVKLQKQFAERIRLVEEQRNKVQESLKKSEELFNNLLQKAFNGELIKEQELINE